VTVDIQSRPWCHKYRKENSEADKVAQEKSEGRKKSLPMEYFCKSLNWSEKGVFFTLPRDKMDLGSGVCRSGHHPPRSSKYSGLSLMMAVDADLRMVASSLGWMQIPRLQGAFSGLRSSCQGG
jgi:hypothetical protein